MTLTPQQQKENLEQIIPFCLLIGFLGNGKRDACVCLSLEDMLSEVKKFETYRVYKFIKVTNDKSENLPE